MRWWLNYLAVAVLTLFTALVTVYYGTAVSALWSGDIFARGLLVLFATLGATSLANLCVPAGFGLRFRSEDAVPRRSSVPISTEIRGRSDV